jgi:agmatine/peptidylarginine deiminase
MVTTIVASNSQKTTVINQYVANGVDTSHCNFLIAPSDSYWTRDYGPWFESDSSGLIGIVDFPYNRPRPSDDEIPKKMAAMLGIPLYGMNVISTGGNYMTDGFGISASTDLVYVENPSQTAAQVDEKMTSYLGITNFQVVPDPNISSTIDHIDCWSKFLGPDKILIRKVLATDPEYNALESAATYWAAQTSSYGHPYKVFRVWTPQDQPYSNSVILNNKVLVPFMNSAWDDSAKAVYEAAMPGYEVIGFIGNPSTPWMSTDALHCRVMGIADIGLLQISHIPISGNQPSQTPFTIDAEIIASSQQPVIADSALIHYRINSGPYQVATMQLIAANQYRGFIPKQPAGTTVSYYLSTADESGRHETLPLIGAADPYVFNTIYTNLAAIPDTLWFLTADDCIHGKITQIHNYLTSALSLDQVQQNGTNLPWWVDSMSVATLPHLLNPGDSVAVRVKVPLSVNSSHNVIFVKDSLKYSTVAGDQYVIIMIDHLLLMSIQDKESISLLGDSYPNPFTQSTEIPLRIARCGVFTLEILDISGIKVKTLIDGILEPGTVTATWDGTDYHGNRLASGLYFYRLTGENQTVTRRMMLLK